MRVFLVALLAALALGGVLRFSRSPAPAPQPLAAIAAPTRAEAPASALAPVTAPARPKADPAQAATQDLPTASLPPEQPRILKVRPGRQKAVPIPQPPQRPRSAAKERGKPVTHERQPQR